MVVSFINIGNFIFSSQCHGHKFHQHWKEDGWLFVVHIIIENSKKMNVIIMSGLKNEETLEEYDDIGMM